MKTAYYTFTVWSGGAMAAGGDGAAGGPCRAALNRQPGPGPAPEGEKIIDLTAWRAANPDVSGEEPLNGESSPSAQPAGPAPRERGRQPALFTAELVSTLCVAAAALAIILRVLTF